MAELIDLSGQIFGRWTVLEYAGWVGSRSQWKCRCACGREGLVSSRNLRGGRSRCCGSGPCRSPAVKHGLRGTPEYEIWAAMKARCLNPKDKEFANYGGRGITVCKRWTESPVAFFEDMGRRPSPAHSLDREDVNGDYEPSNCRWATLREQSNNRRNNRLLTIRGRAQTVAQWAREVGISPNLIHGRLRRDWPDEDAVMLPGLGQGRPYRSLVK